MTGAARIESWLHRAEQILAAGAGEEAPVSLKIGIAVSNRAGAMNIRAIVVGLPDLGQCATHGLSGLVQNAPCDPRNLPNGGCEVFVYHPNVVIQVGRPFFWIIRPALFFPRLHPPLRVPTPPPV